MTGAPDAPAGGAGRFLTLTQVCEEMAISQAQVYAIVRRGDLKAVKVGNRGAWRVERVKLEEYIAGLYVQADAAIAAGALDEGDDPDEGQTA